MAPSPWYWVPGTRRRHSGIPKIEILHHGSQAVLDTIQAFPFLRETVGMCILCRLETALLTKAFGDVIAVEARCRVKRSVLRPLEE